MPSLRLTASRPRLPRDRRSVAALEFALIAPVMVVMAGGVYDLSSAVRVYNEVTTSATTIVASASSAAVNVDGSTALSYDEVQQAESGIWADIPALRNGQQGATVQSVTVSSVSFEPPTACPTGASCNPYTAYVMWSVAYTGGGNATFQPNIRTCSPTGGNSDGNGGEIQVAGNASVNASNFTYTLPTAGVSSYASDATGPAPILVVDVLFTYTPLFGVVPGALTFESSAIWPVRSVKPTQPVTTNGQTILPLAQEFTKIYGVMNGGNFTPYAAPTSSAVASTTPETDAVANTYCVNKFQQTPLPYTTSAQ